MLSHRPQLFIMPVGSKRCVRGCNRSSRYSEKNGFGGGHLDLPPSSLNSPKEKLNTRLLQMADLKYPVLIKDKKPPAYEDVIGGHPDNILRRSRYRIDNMEISLSLRQKYTALSHS